MLPVCCCGSLLTPSSSSSVPANSPFWGQEGGWLGGPCYGTYNNAKCSSDVGLLPNIRSPQGHLSGTAEPPLHRLPLGLSSEPSGWTGILKAPRPPPESPCGPVHAVGAGPPRGSPGALAPSYRRSQFWGLVAGLQFHTYGELARGAVPDHVRFCRTL